MSKEIKAKSKFLSYVLRHNPSKINAQMDINGWVDVKDVLEGLVINQELLDGIVESNNKQRFSYNDDKSKIRANQGHSLDVDVELVEEEPPRILYHGTSEDKIKSILEKGILPMDRQYVHLSQDKGTAIEVGKRHGKAVVLEINTKAMLEDNIKFYKSKNNVWLTKLVENKYISTL